MRKRTPLGPYRGLMPRVLGGPWGGEFFLQGEVPLYVVPSLARVSTRDPELHSDSGLSRYGRGAHMAAVLTVIKVAL